MCTGSVIVDIGTQWLDEHQQGGFFLFLHFWDAHIPYVPPAAVQAAVYERSSVIRTRPADPGSCVSSPTYPLFAQNLYNHLDIIPNLDYIADLYDAEVAYLDYEIGRLFDVPASSRAPGQDPGRALRGPWREHDRA